MLRSTEDQIRLVIWSKSKIKSKSKKRRSCQSA